MEFKWIWFSHDIFIYHEQYKKISIKSNFFGVLNMVLTHNMP